jgi:hypothetical protein
MHSQLLDKWKDGLWKIRKMEEDKTALINAYEAKIKHMLESNKSGEHRLKEQIKRLKQANVQFRQDIVR